MIGCVSPWVADFEDMSCEMVYGQVPTPFEEDPVSKQPCFADICKLFGTGNTSIAKQWIILGFLLVVLCTGSLANPSSTICHKLQA